MLPDGLGGLAIDYIAVVDPTWNETDHTELDNTLHEDGGYLNDPKTKPDAVWAAFNDAVDPFLVVGAQVDVVMYETTNDQRLELSNDQGANWLGEDNTDSFTVETNNFADIVTTLRLRVRLSFTNETRDT